MTKAFCLTWAYIDYAVFVLISFLVAWGSVERHILIFHQNLVATQTKRFLVHYLPLFISTMYPLIYYIIIYLVRPCDVPVDFTKSRCGLSVCAYNDASIGMWDSVVNNILPIFTIVIFSTALLGRVWYNKYRINQRIRWRNYRKMAVQLLSISAIYLVVLFPTTVLYTAYTAGITSDLYTGFFNVTYYISFFVTLLTPFVTVFSLPELRTKLRKMIQFCSLTRYVGGHQILPVTNPTGNRTTPMIALVP